jgi:hypothetical protein
MTRTATEMRWRLPIPFFQAVKEVIGGADLLAWDKSHYVPWYITIIAPDPLAGKRGRYSVLRLNLRTGRMRCIGRELNLRLARRVAIVMHTTRKP